MVTNEVGSYTDSPSLPSAGGGHAQAGSRGRKTRGFPRVRNTSLSDPYGLGGYISNSHNTNLQILNVYLGLKDEDDIALEFSNMKFMVQDKIIRLKNLETNEIVSISIGSRWNTKSHYFNKLRARLFSEVEGLKMARMLTLSFDPELVKSHMPGWWLWGVQEFLIVFGNKYVTRFLKRYRMHWERAGNSWHYIACVMEIQPGTGNVHYHLVFRGSWIGDAKTLMKFWEGSHQPPGLEISKRKNAKGCIRYIAKYVTKLESLRNENKWAYLHKYLWYFRVRIYNIRHKREGKGYGKPVKEEKEKKFEFIRKPSSASRWDDLYND